MFHICKFCVLCGLVLAQSAAAESSRIDALRDRALHAGSYPTTRAALTELESIGRDGETAAREVAGELLARDAAAIEQAAAAAAEMPAAQIRADEETLTRLRPLVLANLRSLTKEDAQALAKAREYYDQLTAAQARVNAALTCADTIRQAMGRRPQLLDAAARRQASPQQADEAKLKSTADKALAALPALIIPPSSDLSRPLPNPSEPNFRAWHYRASRQIDAYNDGIAPRFCNAAEIEHLRILNGYREALGLLPLELDPRLTLAARKHSRDMVEQNYFDHESPDPQQRTSEMRIARAGYAWDAMAENITMSIPPPDARQAFWSWFDSPGHQRNMISANFAAVGIGKWDGYWTQDFGHGARRLSGAPQEEQKKAIAAANDELSPQDR
jgi:uncharacterized protein YkwD